MKTNYFILCLGCLLFILNSCKKDPIPERGELKAWIREDFADEDITLRVDSATVYLDYTSKLESDFIPLVLDLHEGEKLVASGWAKVEGNTMIIDVTHLNIANSLKAQPICDVMVIPFEIGDIYYNLFVSLYLAH